MFKLFKKQKKDKEKNHHKENDDCPMCKISPEAVKQLKEGKKKNDRQEIKIKSDD